MTMTPAVRKLALTAHVALSVGWLGAVAGFLALAIAGLFGENAARVGAAYLAMELIALFVIVPLSLAALLSGLIQSLGTKWGLFRHYWILAKLLIALLSTVVLLVHLQPISYMASVAAETTLASADYRELRIQLVANAGAALLALIAATGLSVYKPKGMTPYGQRIQHEPVHKTYPPAIPKVNGDGGLVKESGPISRTPRWVKVVGVTVIFLVVVFVLLHLMGGGLGGHHRS